MWAATKTWTWSMSGALRDVDGSNGKLVFRSQFGLINFCFSLHISSPIFALPFLLLCFHFGFVLHHVLYERVSTYSFQFLAGMMSIMNSFLSLSLVFFPTIFLTRILDAGNPVSCCPLPASLVVGPYQAHADFTLRSNRLPNEIRF